MKRVLLLLALGVTVGAAGFAYLTVTREQEYRRLIAVGNTALEADRTFEAIEAFSGAIALKQDSMLGYLRRGETYLRQGQLVAAERDLRRAWRLDPTATRPLEALGDVQFAARNYARAAERYADYIRLDDRAPRALYKLALARYRGGDAGGAIPPLRQAVALDGRLAEAYYLLGLCLRGVGKPGDALEALRRTLALAPALVVAREELADLYHELGRTREELEQLETLAVLDPRPTRSVALGLAYARAGEPSRAIRTLSAAAERYPETPGVFAALGKVWLDGAQNGRDRIALSKALGALQAAPSGADEGTSARTLFGHALLFAGDAELAEQVLQEVVGHYPVEPEAFVYLADAAERLGHVPDARMALLKYQALAGDGLSADEAVRQASRIGDLSMRMGDPQTAVEWFKRARERAHAPDGRLHARLAEALWATGDVESARASIGRALELEPGNRAFAALARKIR